MGLLHEVRRHIFFIIAVLLYNANDKLSMSDVISGSAKAFQPMVKSHDSPNAAGTGNCLSVHVWWHSGAATLKTEEMLLLLTYVVLCGFMCIYLYYYLSV